jgi:hypothetical protein
MTRRKRRADLGQVAVVFLETVTAHVPALL